MKERSPFAGQHYGKVFKVATPASWAIVVSGPELINDFRRAADDELSFDDAANEVYIYFFPLFLVKNSNVMISRCFRQLTPCTQTLFPTLSMSA